MFTKVYLPFFAFCLICKSTTVIFSTHTQSDVMCPCGNQEKENKIVCFFWNKIAIFSSAKYSLL